MTPTDPGILLLVPIVLLLMCAGVLPLEYTERGRRWSERIIDWILK